MADEADLDGVGEEDENDELIASTKKSSKGRFWIPRVICVVLVFVFAILSEQKIISQKIGLAVGIAFLMLAFVFCLIDAFNQPSKLEITEDNDSV